MKSVADWLSIAGLVALDDYLQNPVDFQPLILSISVCSSRSALLSNGGHRLEAAKRLELDTIACVVFKNETEARLWEISENLHRAELTALERSEHIAEWIRLTDTVSRQSDAKPKNGRPQSGTRKASRDIGVSEPQGRRSIKIDSLSNEAKQAAVKEGLADNQSALLAAASAPDPQTQVVSITQKRGDVFRAISKGSCL